MAERSLGDWLRHLERIHPREIDLGLTRVHAVARNLGLTPFSSSRVLTVAGTNGKGSVAHAGDAILRAHGQRVGRYTSPHLLRFNERIVVDGEPASDAAIGRAFAAIEQARGPVTLSYFEFATLAALWLFRRAAVDVAVLEVGLGGRLDAVNIVDADIAVITAIALDHQHWLGDSLERIAPEKAAVARAGRPVVLAEPRYPPSLFATLHALGATALRAGDAWAWIESGESRASRESRALDEPRALEESGELEEPGGAVRVKLAGEVGERRFPIPRGLRAANIAAAIQASAWLMRERFSAPLAASALASLRVPARRQVLAHAGRELVLDVAHNPAAMQALVEYLRARPGGARTLAIFGAVRDKDIAAMARFLARALDGALALALPGIERAAAPESVREHLDRAGMATAQTDTRPGPCGIRRSPPPKPETASWSAAHSTALRV